MTTIPQEQQTIPVQIHQAEGLIVLAAPMPGMEPEDISVCIQGERVIIRGDYRGSRQDKPGVILSEWTVGPYYREVVLPEPVHGALANATYGNGVLVLSMPRLEPECQVGVTEFRLESLTDTRGQHIGHTGSEVTPTTTEEQRQKKEQTIRQAKHTSA